MRNLQRAFVLFLLPLLMVGTSCDFNPLGRVTRRTEVKVEIYLDRNLYDCSPESDRGIRRVEVSVHDAAHPTYTPFEMRTFQVCHPKESQALPLVMYITASSPETTTRVWLKVQGFLPEDRHVIQQNAIFGFIPQQTGLVRIYLTENCFRVRECEAYTVTCNPSAERRSCVSSVNEPVLIEQAGDAGLDADVSFVYTHDGSRGDAVAARDAGSHDEGAVAQGDSARDVPAFDAIADDGMDVATMDVTARDDGMDVVEDGGMRAEAGDVMEVSAPDVRDAAVDAPPPNRTCGADLLNDVDNCGECGRRCTAGAGATPACRFGRCALVCPTGFADCDGNAGNGCETDATTAMHCGGCSPCAAGRRCVGGICQGNDCMMEPGVDTCGAMGECVDTRQVSAHCGGCGRTCDGYCNLGRCVRPLQIATGIYVSTSGHVLLMEDGTVQFTGGTSLDQGALPFPMSSAGLVAPKLVSNGWSNVCLLRSDGTVWCWGRNSEGQLGNGGSTDSATPVQVQTSMGVFLRDIVDVSMGNSHVCALSRSGQVYCWGYSANGQSGAIGMADNSVRFATVVAGIVGATGIALGAESSCAWNTRSDRTWSLRCWGGGANGLLGDGVVTGWGAIPQNVVDERGVAWPPADTFITKMAISAVHLCAVLTRTRDAGRPTQEVWCWGNGTGGELGVPSPLAGAYSPRHVMGVPDDATVQSIGNRYNNSAGGASTYVIATDGRIWSWGTWAFGRPMTDPRTMSSTVTFTPTLITISPLAASEWIISISEGNPTCVLTNHARVLCGSWYGTVYRQLQWR